MSSKFILSSDDVQSALAPLMPGYVSPSEGAVEQQVEEESDFSLSGAAGAGVDQLQFMAYNALRAFADEFDVGVLRTVADKGIEVNKQELSEYSRIGYDDIENLSDLNKWWLDNLIINAGSFAPVVAAGMVAAPFGGLVFAGATLLPSAILGTGESYAKQLEAGGNLDSKIAMITGMTVGALDVLTPKKILNAFGIGKGFNNYLTNQLASRGALSNRFHAGVKGMLREGSTEVLQEALMTASKNYVNEQDLTDFNKEEVNELIEAFLSGGSVGATFSAALGEASPQEKAVALAKKNASINLKDTLGSETARIIEEINSLKQNEEFARKGPRGIGSFLNKEGKNRKSELKKELKQLIKDTKSKDKAIFKAKTVEEIDSLFAEPIEEDVATEAPLEEGKTLAEIMAADPRESAIERQQQPDVIPPEGTQIGTAPTQSEIEQRLKDEVATRADKGGFLRRFKGENLDPKMGVNLGELAADRADQGMQDPSVIEDTEDSRPQGPFPRTREAYRKAVAERANRGSAQEERSSNPVISSAVPSDNVLTDGEVLILRQDIEEAKYSKASRELEDIAMQAESDAFEQAEADGMDYPEALAAGNEARERVLQIGGSRRKRVFPNPEARKKAQEESAKARQEREAKLNFEAQRRIDEQKKFEKEQAANLKEQAIEKAGRTYDAFFYGQISAQEFVSRREMEIAEIKDGIGGTAAANAYRKAVPLEKANAILKERGLPTLTVKGEKPTQADTTPPVQKAPPKGGVGSSGQPTNREGKPVDPKAAAPTQADVAPTVGDTQAKVPDISNVVIKDTDPIILEENKRIRELEKKREAIDDALEAGSPELSDLVNGKNLEHEKLLLEEMELRINQRERGLRKRGIDLESSRTYDPSNPRNPLPDFIRDRDKAKKNIEALEAGVDPVTVPGTTMNPDGNKTPTQADVAPPVDKDTLEDTDTSSTKTESATTVIETAHSTETLNDLKGIAKEGLAIGSSTESADKMVYSDGTFRIIFDGPVSGKKTTRAFAPKDTTIKTSEVIDPKKIKRVEVDVGNLPSPTTDNFLDYAEKYLKDKEPGLDVLNASPSEWSRLYDKYPRLEQELDKLNESELASELEINSSNYKAVLADIFGKDVEIVDRVKEKPNDTTTKDGKGAGEQEKGAPKDAKQDDKTTRARSASADDEAKTNREKQDQDTTARTGQATTTTNKGTKVSDAISDFEVADAADTAAQGQTGASATSATVSGETADISTADITTNADSDTATNTAIDTDPIEVTPTEPVRLDYVETTANPEGVPIRIYEDPDTPGLNIVESEGVVLKRSRDRAKAVTYANTKVTPVTVQRKTPKAKAAPKVRPEGKIYKGPEGVLLPGVYKFMSSNKPFKDTLGDMRLKQAKKYGIDTDVVTTEEQLYDELITIIDKMKPVEAPEADIAVEVQKKAKEIVPETPLEKIARNQTERRVKENAIMVQKDLTPEEIASIEEAEQNRIREAQSIGLMEDIDAEIEAQIEADNALSEADRARRKLELESEQVSFETIDNMELADFLQLANSRRGGWSKKQLVEIANNIQANDLTVTFNTKKNRADLAVDLIGWKEGSGSTVDDSVLDSNFVDNENDSGDFHTTPDDNYDPTYGFNNKAVETSSVKPSNEEVLNIERSLDNNLSAMFSRSKAKELKNIKFINFITSSEAKRLGIEDDVIASYGSGDVKVYFIPERIAAYAKSQNKDVDKLTRSLIMHEVGVHAGKNIFSGQEFDLVMDQVVKLYDQKDPEFVNAFNVVKKTYPKLQLFERRFNEEVLAHVIESKAYDLEKINKSLFDKLKTAFQKFFEKLFYTVSGDETRVDNLTPDVTAEDMFNLIAGHSMRNVYSYALKRHGDSKNFSNVRTRNRDNFVKDSLVKSPMFHAGYYNFSAPVLDKTELGLHVGTEKAALERVFGDRQKLKKGYINIQNPFEFNDAGYFGSPKAFQVELGKRAGLVSDEKDLKEYRELFSIAAGWEIAISKIKEPSANAPLLDIHLERVKYAQDKDKAQRGFMEDIRNALISFGYDSIAYKNTQEDVGSISYILLKDNQFKDVDSLMFRSGTNVFMDKRVVEESPEQAVAQSRKIESIAGPQVTNTRKAQGKMFGVLKTMQRAIEPLMTVQGYSELETARMLAKGEVSKAHNTGRVLFDTLYQANKKEQREILKYFETKDASPDNLPDRKVSVAMQPTVARGTRSDARTAERVSIKDSVIQAKKQIEKLGQDLVDMGLITQEQYNELKGSYLPRTYLEYLGKDRLGIGLGTSKLNYTKARTSTDTFLRDVMDGRIKDPGFLAARYISMAGADIATIKYLDFIAADTGQNGWVLPNQIVNFEGMKGTVGFWNERLDGIRRNAAQMESLNPAQAKEMNAFASKLQRAIDAVGTIPAAQGYKRIPDSARYGAMRGLYVKKEIANDIMSQESLYTNNEFLNSVLNVSSKATKVFKYTKVPMNIPTQARNVISNIVLMDTSGTNFFKIPGLLNRAIQDIVSNGKYMELARKYGIESTTFASEELVTMDKELQKIKSQDKSWGGLWARSQVFFNDYLDVGGRAYQKTEVMFKIAKMIDLMENHGKSEAEAAKLANEALLDYSNVSQGVRVIRSMPLGSPFITFNLKAGAQMIRNIRNHPIAVAKYAAIPYIVSQMLLENNDDIEEEDIPAMQKLVADYMEGNMTTMILPWKDEQGRLRVFDMGYFLPWGAHLSMAKNLMEGEFGEAAKTPGFFGGPFELVAGMKTNTDPFTGQSIWSEADPPMQQYQDILGFLVSYATPPMIMPRNKSGDVIGNGGQIVKTLMAAGWMDGNTDADGLPKNTVGSSILSWMGINTAALTAETAGRKVYFKGKDVDKIMQRLIKLIDDPNVKEDQRERLIEEYRMHQANAIEKYREYADAYRQVEDVL
tara:strand:- start:22662 stop:31328 length:8667 start_codon:yes stop_codon:yes gene_type:complete